MHVCPTVTCDNLKNATPCNNEIVNQLGCWHNHVSVLIQANVSLLENVLC